ncbi:MAG TPA: GNAT family N-acetyltransferase [Flavisolibacter sp.]|nr:GNAT family N-acetyltransferase [Flavisolibacter sp.]
MRIQHEESDIRGRHFITDEQGNMLAELTYAVRHPDTMVVDHTEVTDEMRHQNIGHELVEAVAEHARAKGRHIIPVCPFVRSIMTQDGPYSDIVRSERIDQT